MKLKQKFIYKGLYDRALRDAYISGIKEDIKKQIIKYFIQEPL